MLPAMSLSCKTWILLLLPSAVQGMKPGALQMFGKKGIEQAEKKNQGYECKDERNNNENT